MHSLRLAGVVAKQDVIFGGTGEVLTLTHETLASTAYEAGIRLALRRCPHRSPGWSSGSTSCSACPDRAFSRASRVDSAAAGSGRSEGSRSGAGDGGPAGVYLLLVVQLAFRLIAVDLGLAKALGIALIVLPLLGFWALVVELLFGIRSGRLVQLLAEDGALPTDTVPLRPSGRPDRSAADAEFPRYQAAGRGRPRKLAGVAAARAGLRRERGPPPRAPVDSPGHPVGAGRRKTLEASGPR